MSALRRTALGLVLPAALVAAWWIATADNASSIYYPPLRDILAEFRETWLLGDRFASDLVPSVLHLVAGFGVACVVGIAGGTLLGVSERARRNMWLPAELGRATPTAALVPLAFVLVGPGARMEVGLIAFACVWPILLSTIDGIRGVDPLMLDMGRAYGLKRGALVRRVTIPAAMPQIAAGLRVALGIAVAAMVVANMFGASDGLGAVVINAQQGFDLRATWAGLLIIGIVGLLANLTLIVIQHFALAWHRGWRASTMEAAQ